METQFRILLRERGVASEDESEGFGGSGDGWLAVWETFVAAAEEGSDDLCSAVDDDLLLHESGLSDDGCYAVWFTRQRVSRSPDGEYLGMTTLTLTIASERIPEGRVPRAQRWGYAGPRRADVDDDTHPRIERWAGHSSSWASAVVASNSFAALKINAPTRWSVQQSPV